MSQKRDVGHPLKFLRFGMTLRFIALLPVTPHIEMLPLQVGWNADARLVDGATIRTAIQKFSEA